MSNRSRYFYIIFAERCIRPIFINFSICFIVKSLFLMTNAISNRINRSVKIAIVSIFLIIFSRNLFVTSNEFLIL